MVIIHTGTEHLVDAEPVEEVIPEKIIEVVPEVIPEIVQSTHTAATVKLPQGTGKYTYL